MSDRKKLDDRTDLAFRLREEIDALREDREQWIRRWDEQRLTIRLLGDRLAELASVETARHDHAEILAAARRVVSTYYDRPGRNGLAEATAGLLAALERSGEAPHPAPNVDALDPIVLGVSA